MDGFKLYSDHHVLSRYFSVVVASLIIYDCSLTLCEEIRAVWGPARHAWTSGIALFLNRIFLTAIAILNILWVCDNGASCKVVGVLDVSFNLLCVVITAVISAIRVYVIRQRHGSLTILTLVLGLVPVGTNVFIYSRDSFSVASLAAFRSICVSGPPAISKQLFTRALIATRTCAIASDVLVVVVTWIFAYDSVRQSSAQYGHGIASITKVIVEDGTFYFIAISLLNVADLTLYFSDGGYDTLAIFIFPISSILVSRFLLHIRKVAHFSPYCPGDFDTQTPSFIRTHSRRQATSSIAFKFEAFEATPFSSDLSTTASTHQSEFSLDETDEEDWDWSDDRYALKSTFEGAFEARKAETSKMPTHVAGRIKKRQPTSIELMGESMTKAF